MEGTLYSVGIGPGDPELMTLKAVRLIVEADVIAIPQGDNDILTAKNIVNQVVDLSAKEQLLIYMPMTKDMVAMDKAHDVVGILVSGDVGFFSLTKTIAAKLTNCKIKRCPGISSLVYFAQALNMSWDDAKIISMLI